MTLPRDIAGWREVHIGFENDGLTIDGVDIRRRIDLRACDIAASLPSTHPVPNPEEGTWRTIKGKR